jgi:probable F420-dependent oxidoreductase
MTAAGPDPTPRFSVGLPQTLVGEDPRPIAGYAIRAEALGFAGLWTLDSPVGGPTGHTPLLDGLHMLSHAAAVTDEVRLGIAVIVLPRRNPAMLAKELATIDRLSGGRLTVGVGLGRDDERIAGLGFPTGRRVRRLTEGVEVMRALWAQGLAAHEGELYRFSGVRMEPKPLQRPGPPVWLGAGREPALRRAVRIGDGWIGSGSSSSEDFTTQAAFVARELGDTGRDPARFAIAKRVYIAVEEDASVARQRLAAVLDAMYDRPGLTERCAVCGPPEHCAQVLRDLAAAGAQELVLAPMYGHLAQLEALDEVVHLVRKG